MMRLEGVGIVGFAALCVGGCTNPNPAFDGAEIGAEVGAEASASGATGTSGGSEDTSTSGEGSESESDSDTASESETDTETDPGSEVGTGEEEAETGEEESCEFTVRRPPLLAVRPPDDGGNLDCPWFINDQAMWIGLDGVNLEDEGMAEGSFCLDFGCEWCPGVGAAIGAPGFGGLASTWAHLAALAGESGLDGLCMEITALELRGQSEGMCIYGAMGLWENGVSSGPVFAAQVHDAPLTWLAQQLLDGAAIPLEAEGSCSCESVLGADSDELECCELSGDEPTFYSVNFEGLELLPGDSALIPGWIDLWEVHLLQAQSVKVCEDTPEIELSWAVTWVE